MFNTLSNLRQTATWTYYIPAWSSRLGHMCLQVLMNMSLNSSVVPRQERNANILPVPKVSMPKTPSDFRPISITSVILNLSIRHQSSSQLTFQKYLTLCGTQVCYTEICITWAARQRLQLDLELLLTPLTFHNLPRAVLQSRRNKCKYCSGFVQMAIRNRDDVNESWRLVWQISKPHHSL